MSDFLLKLNDIYEDLKKKTNEKDIRVNIFDITEEKEAFISLFVKDVEVDTISLTNNIIVKQLKEIKSIYNNKSVVIEIKNRIVEESYNNLIFPREVNVQYSFLPQKKEWEYNNYIEKGLKTEEDLFGIEDYFFKSNISSIYLYKNKENRTYNQYIFILPTNKEGFRELKEYEINLLKENTLRNKKWTKKFHIKKEEVKIELFNYLYENDIEIFEEELNKYLMEERKNQDIYLKYILQDLEIEEDKEKIEEYNKEIKLKIEWLPIKKSIKTKMIEKYCKNY